MSKYFIVYKNSLSTYLQYRLNLGLLALSHLVSLSGLVYLWIAVYGSGQTLGNYTLEQIIFYYIVLSVVQVIIAEGVGMGFEVSDDINQGVITNYLLKPFNYSFEQFLKLCGKATINAIFILPAVLLLTFLFKQTAELPPFINWLEFIGMMCVGLIFYFLIYYLAALASFWLTYGRSVIFGTLVISNFLNGGLMPLDTFPDWFQKINVYSPFKFLLFMPIQAFLGRIQNWNIILLSCSAWIIIFILIIMFVWRQGIKKYEAVGR